MSILSDWFLGTVIDSTSATWARASERRQMIGQVVVGGTAAPRSSHQGLSPLRW